MELLTRVWLSDQSLFSLCLLSPSDPDRLLMVTFAEPGPQKVVDAKLLWIRSWENLGKCTLESPASHCIGANGTVSAFDSWKLFRLSLWQNALIPCWHIIIYHLGLAQCYFGDVLSGAGSVWCRPGLVLASILVDNHGAAAAAVPTRPPAIVEWTTRGLHTNCAPEPHPPIRVLLSCSK